MYVCVCTVFTCELGNWLVKSFSRYILICSSRRRNLKCALERQQVSSALMDFDIGTCTVTDFFASVAFQLPATSCDICILFSLFIGVYLLFCFYYRSKFVCVVHYTCPFRPLFVLSSPSGDLLSVMHVQRPLCMRCMQSCMHVCLNCSSVSFISMEDWKRKQQLIAGGFPTAFIFSTQSDQSSLWSRIILDRTSLTAQANHGSWVWWQVHAGILLQLQLLVRPDHI